MRGPSSQSHRAAGGGGKGQGPAVRATAALPPQEDRAWTAQVEWQQRGHKARFALVAEPAEEGPPAPLMRSPAFEWPPAKDDEVQAMGDAVAMIEQAALAAGWSRDPDGSAWYARRFRWEPHDVPGAMGGRPASAAAGAAVAEAPAARMSAPADLTAARAAAAGEGRRRRPGRPARGGTLTLNRVVAAVGVLTVAVVVPVLALQQSAGGAEGGTMTLAAGRHPVEIASDGKTVWVAARAGQLTLFDARTGRRGDSIAVGGPAARMAVGPAGAWIAEPWRGVVVPVAKRPLRTLAPLKIAGVTDVAVTGRGLWAADPVRNVVHRLASPRAVPTTVRVGLGPIALAVGDRWAVVANAGDRTITPVTAGAQPHAGPAIPAGPAPADVAVAGQTAWVADGLDGTVREIDLGTGARRVRSVPVGTRLSRIVGDARGVYVLGAGGRLVELRPGDLRVRSRRDVGAHAVAIALDARYVWIADGATGKVTRLDR